MEYVYADWNLWQTNRITRHADQESLASQDDRVKDTGSQVEGFCVPQFLLMKSDIDRVNYAFDIEDVEED